MSMDLNFGKKLLLSFLIGPLWTKNIMRKKAREPLRFLQLLKL